MEADQTGAFREGQAPDVGFRAALKAEKRGAAHLTSRAVLTTTREPYTAGRGRYGAGSLDDVRG